MDNFNEKISGRLKLMATANLSKEEKAVMRILVKEWQEAIKNQRDVREITQRQIAQDENWLGCHAHEYNKVDNPDETTLRKVRQIIRDLRIKYGSPIISTRDGYFIPTNQQQVNEYLNRVEAVARSQAKSWLETYKAMTRAFNVQSSFFDRFNI